MHQLTLTSLMHVKFEGVLDLSFVRVSQKEHFNNAHILLYLAYSVHLSVICDTYRASSTEITPHKDEECGSLSC